MTEPAWSPDATSPDATPSLASDAPGMVAADLLSLLADSRLSSSAIGYDTVPDYDLHIALALDTGASLDLAPMLDALTSSSQLFDVPVLDHVDAPVDAPAT
jgi:hypothetical protein